MIIITLCSCPILYLEIAIEMNVSDRLSFPNQDNYPVSHQVRCNKEKEYGLYRYKWKITNDNKLKPQNQISGVLFCSTLTLSISIINNFAFVNY